MKITVTLPDALHARPANLLVRLASSHDPEIRLAKGALEVSAKNILDVLSLGAAKGDEIVLVVEGGEDEARAASAALRELIERNFDADLVPETGTAGVTGIAVGRAAVLQPRDWEGAPAGTREEEATRLQTAFARVSADLDLLVGALPRDEAGLFDPERAIVTALLPRALSRVASGARAEQAVTDETASAATDLVLDAKSRLLEALGEPAEALAWDEETVFITDELTPSLVARLPQVVRGIVAAHVEDAPAGFTSHAAILARGRQLPLAFVPPHVTAGIEAGDLVLLDATETPARVWVAPSEALVARARARRAEIERDAARSEDRARASLAHLGIAVRVNVGAREDAVPGSAEGIGLLRTELLFAGRRSSPSESEQLAALLTIAGKVKGPVVARLFDAGGDKPLPWLPAPEGAPDARGIDLLCRHEIVLSAQLRAMERARAHADVRVLLPLVASERDVLGVRERLAASVPVGAMIETPEAAHAVETIAEVSDFVCIGTNDLSAAVLGVRRDGASVSLDPQVLALVARVVRGARAKGKEVTVCGEMAADERGAQILVGLGVHGLSVPPSRVAPVRILLSETTREACEGMARDALARATLAPP